MQSTSLPRYDGPLRVVIAHDMLIAYGGAERVFSEMLDAFPSAELWAMFGSAEIAAAVAPDRPVNTLLPESAALNRHFRLLSPALPALVRARRLPPADVLLTSSWAFVHGLRTRNRAPQACFCHSPLRYAWSATSEYRQRWARSPGAGAAFNALAAAMRAADRRAARRVDTYMTISRFVGDQIRRFYGVEPRLLPPPVDVDRFRPSGRVPEEYFLFSGRLIEPYKHPTAAVEAFRLLPDRRLIVAGDGPEMAALRSGAPENVTFLGHVGDEELIPLLQGCSATIFPSADDFGLVPLEAMACGRPVLALAAGGALDTVHPGSSGAFFEAPTAEAIAAAVRDFDPGAFDSGSIRAYAMGWDRRLFRRSLIDAVTEVAATG